MASMTIEYTSGEKFAKIVFIDNEETGGLDFCTGHAKGGVTEAEFDMLIAAEGERVDGWKSDWY